MTRGAKVALAVVCFLQFVPVPPAFAQAWLPAKGEGNLAFTYQNSLARGHLFPGNRRAPGALGNDPVRAHALSPEAEFGLSDRVAVTLSLPFVTTRYGGVNPHAIGVQGQPNDIDDGNYHGAFQDFRLGLRFNVVSRPLMVTPFVEGIIPSHHYESRGHAVIGQDLRAFVVGASLGGFSDSFLPGTYFQAQLSHAVVQKVAGIRPNRSRVDTEIGYFVTPRLAVRLLENFQITHDGLDFPYAGLPRDLSLNHDRLSRNNLLNLGGGFVFAVNERLSVFAAVAKLVWGENTHRHLGVGGGANWHFRTGRATVRPSRTEARTTPEMGLIR